MSRHTFFCIDGHTAGNPVRLIAGGAPRLEGANMSALRADFLERFDWIRKSLMFEPRGHDMMSGGFLYPPFDADSDAAILFVETSGCLPMCGHGTIGIVTFGLENGLIQPRREGRLTLEVPAGTITVEYAREGDRVVWVRLRNVASYLVATGVAIEIPELGVPRRGRGLRRKLLRHHRAPGRLCRPRCGGRRSHHPLQPAGA